MASPLPPTLPQMNPDTQVGETPAPAGQQVSPGPPQAELPHLAQTLPRPLPLQRVSGAVQVEPAQQGWPGPPQLPQLPAVQVPSRGAHELPAETHLPLAQQPSPWQVLPAQQT